MNLCRAVDHVIINMYHSQLSKFRKIGIGNETEFGTMITENLINITEKRLNQLYIGKKKWRKV